MLAQTQSHDAALIVQLPRSLDRILRANLRPDEKILVALRGMCREALVCTDRRVLIIKTGYMTGHIFGSNVFQLPYASITGAQVNAHLLTGYFELSAGGVQNVPKSYWQDISNSFHGLKGTTAPQAPQRAPHCVSLRRNHFQVFRAASAFIMQQAELARSPAAQHSLASDPIGLVEQLSRLRETGILSDAEFQTKKAEILARL
jgi:hypothetical protein